MTNAEKKRTTITNYVMHRTKNINLLPKNNLYLSKKTVFEGSLGRVTYKSLTEHIK